nr:protein SET domain group 40 [Tanacetum cinerariifolium]
MSSRTMRIPWDAAGCFYLVDDFFNCAAPDAEQVLFEDSTNADMGATSLRLIDGVFKEKYDAYCFYARRYYKIGEHVILSYETYTNLSYLSTMILF